jgi:hypothetical protein
MKVWLGRQDSNLRVPVPKTGALPLGHAPTMSEYHNHKLHKVQDQESLASKKLS